MTTDTPWHAAAPAPAREADEEVLRRYNRRLRLDQFDRDLRSWERNKTINRPDKAGKVAYRRDCLARWQDYIDGKIDAPTGRKVRPDTAAPAGDTVRGGARPGSGQPARPLGISAEHARTLKSILLLTAPNYDKERAEIWARHALETAIDAAWCEINQNIDAAAAKA